MIGVSTKVLVQMYIHAGVKYASKNTNIFPLGKLLIFAAKKLLILILILILSLFQHSAISPSFFTRSSIGANTNICMYVLYLCGLKHNSAFLVVSVIVHV